MYTPIVFSLTKQTNDYDETAKEEVDWLGGRDSNPDSQIQSLESYHWTTSQQRNLNLRIGLRVVNRAHNHSHHGPFKTKCLNLGVRKRHNGPRSIGLRHTPIENNDNCSVDD